MKSAKILFILFILFILSIIVNAGDPFRVDQNIEMGQNDVYNATNVNATYLWQDGLAVLDTNSTLNSSNINQSKLNVNSSTYWDEETSQADLNVNHSNSTTWWATVSGWLSGWFVKTGNDLGFNESKLNTTINNSIDARSGILNVNSSTYWNEETSQANLNVNSSDNWDNLDTPVDITTLGNVTLTNATVTNLKATNLEENLDGTGFNITLSWLLGFINWSNVQNKFITAVDNIYLYMSSTTITLNETKLNETINNSIDARSGLLNVNSSDNWDNLNTPSDINAGDITDDGTYILSSIEGDLNVNHSNSTTWWATVSGWLSGWFVKTGNDLGFNESKLNDTIDARTASITYNATIIATIEGTLDDGNITSIQSIDDNWYNVSEDAGGSPLLIEINFSGIDTFSNVLLRTQYIGGLGHEVEVQTWNYDSSAWESHGDITDQSTMTELVIDVLDASDHISGGLVQLRFDHQQNGVATHDFYIDYVALQEGFTSITSAEHDSLLGRDSTDNHPWALATDASKNLSANWDAGNIDITADTFNGSWNGSINYYLRTEIASIVGDINNLSIQDVNDTQGNWSGDRSDYYTQAEIDAFNSSGSYNASQLNGSPGSFYVFNAGNGISESSNVFSVAGNTCLDQDADGLSVTNNCIGDTQLEFDTGQTLTNTSDVIHKTVTVNGTICINLDCSFNLSGNCTNYPSGGQICSGT